MAQASGVSQIQEKAKKTALGAAASLLSYVLLLSIAAALIVRGTVGEGQLKRCVWLCAFLAAFAGAEAAAWHEGSPASVITICISLFWAVNQLLGLLANGNLALSRSLWMILPVFAGGALALVLRPKSARKSKRRKKRAARR